VISASAGNHALALAYHGHLLNIAVTVVMPHITPLMKLELCRQFGASVIVHGNDFFEVCRSSRCKSDDDTVNQPINRWID